MVLAGASPINTFILCPFLDDLISVTPQPPCSMRLGKSRSALAHKPGGAGGGRGRPGSFVSLEKGLVGLLGAGRAEAGPLPVC